MFSNMKLVTTKFTSGGLHAEHVVATWNLGNHERAGVPEAAQTGFGKHLVLGRRVRQTEKRTETLIKIME